MCVFILFTFVFKVMVFVHARNSTVRTAMALIEIAKNRGESSFFFADQGAEYGHLEKQVRESSIIKH